MKSHKLLYQLKNKLTWLPILILAACQNNIIYHSYAPVPLDGWDKSDTLVYTLPNSIPAGNYEAEIGIRYQESYPYRDIWLEVSHNTKDTLTYVTDTLQLFLVDEAGNKTGNGLCGLYQCDLPYKASILSVQKEAHVLPHRPYHDGQPVDGNQRYRYPVAQTGKPISSNVFPALHQYARIQKARS